MIDLHRYKKDFPILSRKIHGKPFTYLDNGATSQKPSSVIEAMNEFQTLHNANVHRGIYTVSEEATEKYESVRVRVADFIGASSTEEIIFTRNATESINLVALSWARQHLKKGDEIITTIMEHHSNIVPWQMLAKEKGLVLRYVPIIGDAGMLDIDAFSSLLSAKTKLVCVAHMSNLLGTVNPIKVIVEKSKVVGARVLVDGCQAVPHMPVTVSELGADFYVFSSHKLLGPSGVGVLWAKKEILENTEPLLGGGDMIKTVTTDGATWNDLPWKFEAGTPNIVGVIGLGSAIEYLQNVGMDTVWEHEQKITEYVLPRLVKESGVTVYGMQEPHKDRGAIFSFWLDGMHPHDLASLMDEDGIAIRAGHMCAQPVLDVFHRPAAARASFYIYNTREDADVFLNAIKKAKSVFSV